MRNRNEPSDAEIDRSQSMLAAVLGDEEVAKLNGSPPPGIGHNSPPTPIELANDDVAALIANVGAWDKARPVIENEGDAAACNDFLAQLEKKYKYYDALRKAEKTPHDEKAAAVQAKWKPPLANLLRCKEAIEPRHNDWLARVKRQLADERHEKERLAAEAERRADQLTRQAEAPGPGTLPNMIAAAEAAAEAAAARKAVAAVPERAQTHGTLGGRTRSLQTRWYAQVYEWDLWYAQVRDRAEVKDLLSRLANEAVRSKDGPRPADGAEEGINAAMPGCLIYSQES